MINLNNYDEIKSEGNAELTNRLIPGDEDFSYPEWVEYGTLRGIPVVCYYRTTPGDQEIADNIGCWGGIDWKSRLDRIEIDICEADRLGITDGQISAALRMPWIDCSRLDRLSRLSSDRI